MEKGPRNIVPADYVIFAFYMYIFKDLLTCMGLNAEAKCSFNCAICFLRFIIFWCNYKLPTGIGTPKMVKHRSVLKEAHMPGL